MKQGQWHGKQERARTTAVVCSLRCGSGSLRPVLIHRLQASLAILRIHPSPPPAGSLGPVRMIQASSTGIMAGGQGLWSGEWWWTWPVICTVLLLWLLTVMRHDFSPTASWINSRQRPHEPHVVEHVKDPLHQEPLAEVQIVDIIQELDSVTSDHEVDAAVKILSHQDHRTKTPMVIDLVDIRRAGAGTEMHLAEVKQSVQARPSPQMSAQQVSEPVLPHPDASPMVSGAQRTPSASAADAPGISPASAVATQLSSSSMQAEERARLDRHSYASLLATSQDVIAEQIFKDPAYVLAPELPRGPSLSLNTTKYHHMGYFMKMKAQIEQVWSFPSQARLGGMSGDVKVMFQIEKSGELGKIRILQSSGYPVLDREVVRTLALAAPFDPLPSVWSEQALEVTGMFSYVLQ